jgi:hypothetical protein
MGPSALCNVIVHIYPDAWNCIILYLLLRVQSGVRITKLVSYLHPVYCFSAYFSANLGSGAYSEYFVYCSMVLTYPMDFNIHVFPCLQQNVLLTLHYKSLKNILLQRKQLDYFNFDY